MSKKGEGEHDIGMIGLGVMGRNLVLNMAEHGFAIAGYDNDPQKLTLLERDAGNLPVRTDAELVGFLRLLKPPRAVMMLVPAGKVVDQVINEVAPHLRSGDLIIDAGNSFFEDTDRRAGALRAKGVGFLGVGVSGGEAGARHGPSIMPGGHRGAYERVRPIFEAAAAHVDGEPCVTYLGEGSAGHFVKMVHNGIEYAVIGMIADTYDLMKRGLGLSDDELHAAYARWNQGELASFLVEITADIFLTQDEKTGKRLVDVVLDAAAQKGTGRWTSQTAMDLGVPTPSIDIAVSMRTLSAAKGERERTARLVGGQPEKLSADRDLAVEQIGRALYAGTILAYAQGVALLAAGDRSYGFGYDIESVARIWRGGCIIRSALLEEIRAAFRRQPRLESLLQDEQLGNAVSSRQADLRAAVQAAARAGIPAPHLMTALGYWDASRSAWLPANLIQAQRDYFGAHTYERIDQRGSFHSEWAQGKAR